MSAASVVPSASRPSRWLAPLRHWPQTALDVLRTHDAVARIVIVDVRGSAPRETGTCMLLDADATYGSIGGGQLEWAAMMAARELLVGVVPARVLRLVLGTELAQCCGGVVELWIERYTRADSALLQSISKLLASGRGMLASTLEEGRLERRIVEDSVAIDVSRHRWHCDSMSAQLWEPLNAPATPLWLYGAGHVGQALVRVLDTLPFAMTWIDARAALLPDEASFSVQRILTPDPVTTVTLAPSGTMFLVMTHSHPLDYALCQAVLGRDDAAWLGLIGSKSKAARFRSRLKADGLASERVARLVSPIGMAGIESKLPAAIAVAVAAQLLERQSALAQAEKTRREVGPACTGCAAASRGC